MKKNKPWTKKELALRPGVLELALAVVEQWKKDGSPDEPGIKPWLNIIRMLMED